MGLRRFLAFQISDNLRTGLAYVTTALNLCAVGLALSVAIYCNIMQRYLADFTALFENYSGGQLLTMLTVIGIGVTIICSIGSYVCFRSTISLDRKKMYQWMVFYVVAVACAFLAVLIAYLVCLFHTIDSQKAFKVCCVIRLTPQSPPAQPL